MILRDNAVLNALRKLPEKDQQSIGAKLLREDFATTKPILLTESTTEGAAIVKTLLELYRRVARRHNLRSSPNRSRRGAHAGSEAASSGPRSVDVAQLLSSLFLPPNEEEAAEMEEEEPAESSSARHSLASKLLDALGGEAMTAPEMGVAIEERQGSSWLDRRRR